MTATRTFRCPITGLELERPPAVDIRDEYLRFTTLGSRDRLVNIIHAVEHGRYHQAAAACRRLATYLDNIPDVLHDLHLDIEEEAGDLPWTTPDLEDTPA